MEEGRSRLARLRPLSGARTAPEDPSGGAGTALTLATLIAPTPFVGEAVERIRRRADWSAALGVPAHVTLLGPFLDPDAITPHTLERLRALVGSWAPIDLSFDRLELMADVACLLSNDASAVAALSRALSDEWPDIPRRTSQHVTVARDLDQREFATVAEAVGPHLPFAGTVTCAQLLVRRNGGAVSTVASFPFAGRSGCRSRD